MPRYACLIPLALLCAGCTQDWGPNAIDQRAASNPRGEASPLSLAKPSAQSRPAIESFASLPDLGDLVGYPRQRVIRHDGAYTWHRADISEEHALRAISGGALHITTPSGEALDFRYERHVEHPSGDWTWVGRIGRGASSEEAIVTFGDRAAFGTIGQPGKAPLKLTIRDGVAWLVETDRAKIASIDNPATRPRNPDYLVAPKHMAAGSNGPSSGPSAEASDALPAASAASTTVDVLLGYTSGYAAAFGGQSQAVTRLNNRVEIANQTYVNSQVDARIRLVHAMQVNYPDNTPNDSTLESLTGFRAPSTEIPPDPAFAALRATRDQYGADLVSLVRKFNTPENDGCGIAWLIGGDRRGISIGDARFGYSVVSDGQDAGTDGKTYFCRDETLVHELGHNMGLQHDRAAAAEDGTLNYGAYDYTFGYKAGAGAGNFYTVMAYGDTGQTDYRIFSNPSTTFCGGLTCGLSNQADNARGLRQTMPIIASFRNAITASTPFDLNQDGRSDLLWYGQGSRFAYWLMLGSQPTYQSPSSATPSGFVPVATGDFNADGYWDALWSNSAEIRMRLATANGGASWVSLGNQPSGWKVIGAEDLDGDGRADLLWHNVGASRFAYWLMSGSSVLYRAPSTPLASGFAKVAIGDLNGDGYGDMVWSNNLSLSVRLGAASGNGSWYSLGAQPAGWKVVGAGDIDSNGRADLLWHNAQANRFAYWLMNGTTVTFKSASTALAPGFVAVAGGDYNGDGYWDMVWSNNQTLSMRLAGSNGRATWVSVGSHPAGWKLIGP